jgi:hypothetical protein
VKHTPLAPFLGVERRFLFFISLSMGGDVMFNSEFEERYQAFWKEQVRGAEGQRLEMLHRDLTGTKLLLSSTLLPVFGGFEGLCWNMRW